MLRHILISKRIMSTQDAKTADPDQMLADVNLHILPKLEQQFRLIKLRNNNMYMQTPINIDNKQRCEHNNQ